VDTNLLFFFIPTKGYEHNFFCEGEDMLDTITFSLTKLRWKSTLQIFTKHKEEPSQKTRIIIMDEHIYCTQLYFSSQANEKSSTYIFSCKGEGMLDAIVFNLTKVIRTINSKNTKYKMLELKNKHEQILKTISDEYTFFLQTRGAR
jgi:uncharacterized lipoprotein YehR (DUF1307 family)